MSVKSGIIAGSLATIVCSPLDIIRVNIQAKKISSEDTIKYIYRNFGIRGFYKGLNYGLITIPTFWSIYFPTYEHLKTKINTPVAAYLSCNLSSTVTSPLWYIRQKKQTFTNFNIIEEFKKLRLSQFYSGLLTTYIINLNFVFQIPIYEYIKFHLENHKVFNIFLASSFSKIVASLITFPLENVRVLSRQNSNLSIISILKILNQNKNYYKGLNNYLIRSIPYHSIVFCTYEYLRH